MSVRRLGLEPLREVAIQLNRNNQQIITERQAVCLACGGTCRTQATALPDVPDWARGISGKGGLFLVCSRCKRWGCRAPHGLTLMRPETQQFWRRCCRIRVLPVRLLNFAQRPAVAVPFESVTGRAIHGVFLDRETLHVLHVSLCQGSSAAPGSEDE
jgi:hypothetical protein